MLKKTIRRVSSLFMEERMTDLIPPERFKAAQRWRWKILLYSSVIFCWGIVEHRGALIYFAYSVVPLVNLCKRSTLRSGLNLTIEAMFRRKEKNKSNRFLLFIYIVQMLQKAHQLTTCKSLFWTEVLHIIHYKRLYLKSWIYVTMWR